MNRKTNPKPLRTAIVSKTGKRSCVRINYNGNMVDVVESMDFTIPRVILDTVKIFETEYDIFWKDDYSDVVAVERKVKK